MNPRPMILLGGVLLLGCGGRRILNQAETDDAGTAGGSGTGTTTGGGFGAPKPVCTFDGMGLAAGETRNRDCNVCACAENGDVTCTHESCSCVQREPRYPLSTTFPRGAVAPGDLPTCIPSCGAVRHFGSDPILSVDALPRGSCDPYPYPNATCKLSVHETCACPNEIGTINDYSCACGENGWQCSVYSQGAAGCADGCIADGGIASGDVDADSCELTRELNLVSPSLIGELRVGETVNVSVFLRNAGPLDHLWYPGVELKVDSAYWKPAAGAPIASDALYGLAAGENAPLAIPITVIALPSPCSQIVFHLQVRSFGKEEHCLGATLDYAVVLPRPNGENCPQCPAQVPSQSAPACDPAGLSCSYPGDPSNCACPNGQWACAYDLR